MPVAIPQKYKNANTPTPTFTPASNQSQETKPKSKQQPQVAPVQNETNVSAKTVDDFAQKVQPLVVNLISLVNTLFKTYDPLEWSKFGVRRFEQIFERDWEYQDKFLSENDKVDKIRHKLTKKIQKTMQDLVELCHS